MHLRIAACLLLCVGTIDAGGLLAAEPAGDEAAVEAFEKTIRPLLAERCYECHGPEKQESGLRLDRVSAILKGGESGPAVVPGDVKASLLVQAIEYGTDFAQMPPDGKLPEKEIALLTDWVARGAPGPRDEPDGVAEKPAIDLAARKQHWCWQPVQKIAPPAVQDQAWARMAVDRFILAKLEAAGLRPAPAADRATWLRRVSFDLIGLPPTPEEVEKYMSDKSESAEQAVVDRLLESPHFGERWGRHWLDLVRYAETLGHEFDYPIHHAHQYRDYVIRAWNADVPYDQFVTEHIAGDLLPRPRLHPTEGYNESIIATGFWFLGEATHAPVDARGDEMGRMDNQIDVLTKAFLGVTVGCARCHDHKFDAITQADYYALAGFLKSSRRQEAIIDRQGGLEKGATQLRSLREQGTAAMAAALPATSDNGSKSFTRLLLAAREVMHGEPRPADEDPLAPDIMFDDFESDNLDKWLVAGAAAEKSLANGTVANQMPVSGFHGKHLINTYVGADEPTGKLTSGSFRIERRFIRFLIGGGAHQDRTCINLKVNGKVVRTATGKNDERLSPAGWDVADLKGKTGTLEIVDDHTGGWGHINLDDIVFSDKTDGVTFRRPATAVAEEFQIDPAALERLAVTLASDGAKQPDHPFYAWSVLSAEPDEKNLATRREQLAAQLADLERAAAEAENKSELFADFNGGDFSGWLATGQAFGDRPTQPGEWDAQARGWQAVEPGAAHSGQLAPRLRGVLRSPSFTIHKPFIDYRLAGKNAQVRVIIDGYVMDVFNGLLFGGVSFPVADQPKLTWTRQGGDYSRYQGHRAHIELIDDGDGFIAVDEIRFSDGPGQPAHPSQVARQIAGDARIVSRETLAASYAEQLGQALAAWNAGQANSGQAALARFALAQQLVPLLPFDGQPAEARLSDISRQMDEANAALPEPLRAVAIADGPGEDEWLLNRGNHKTPGSLVRRRFLEAIDGPEGASLAGSGRLQLAERIVDPANPLTSRVIVNRLWQHLFGRGIVATVDNFGVLGEQPTHPELLDYLAGRLPELGWSRKKLIRELVLSNAYRMSSQSDAEADQADPQNRLLHRMNVKRLEGEIIRDAVLAVSGRLDRKQFGGSVATHLTPFMEGRGRPGGNGPLDGDGRRSIYLEVRRNFLNPMFLAFDFPIPFNAIGRRTESNVPAQALTMMNDPLIVTQAQQWAQRLLIDGPADDAARIERMYLTLFARRPTDDEQQAARSFLTDQSGRYSSPPGNVRPWSDLAHVLMNVKEFIFVN